MTEINNYDKILEGCTGDYRLCLEKPFPHGKYIIATDAYCLVRIDANKCDAFRDIKKVKDLTYPDYDRIFPTQDCDILLPYDKLVEAIKSIPESELVHYKPRQCECEECDGSGNVYWTYEDNEGNDHCLKYDCPICDGKGYFTSKPTDRKERIIAINNELFVCDHLIRIATAMRLLNKSEAHILHLDSHSQIALLVRIEDGVDFLVASRRSIEPRATITL